MTGIAAIVLGMIALIGWLNHLRYQRFQLNAKFRNERFNHVIDRFGNEKDFLEFLQSEKGMQIMSVLTFPPTSTKVPVLVMISSGVVAMAMGAGAFVLAYLKDSDLLFPGVFLSAAGLGLLVAAAISHHLSRKWGVFEEHNFSETTSLLRAAQRDVSQTSQ